jgi:ethanolamine ammonia-lyase small subunit
MKKRLVALGVMNESGEASRSGAASLYSAYQRAGGDTRTSETLREEATRRIDVLSERGFDLGTNDDSEVVRRIDAIYEHARRALYAKLDDAVIRDVSAHHLLRVQTNALDRDDYLAHPAAGEVICEQDAARISELYPTSRPRLQVVVSDGLNANAVNQNLRLVLPHLRRQLAEDGHNVGNVDIVIRNGRVRAGYDVGRLLDVEAVVHFIGERPGTGIDTMSAYLSYGRDATGRSRWGASFEHSWTTAVCGIHHLGKKPETAAEEIARLVTRMLEQRCSGVALR